MDGRWRHLEIALHVRLSRWQAVILVVGVDVGKVLPLPGGKGALYRQLLFNDVSHSGSCARNP